MRDVNSVLWWTAIVAHTVCGVIAFTVGFAALRRDTVRRHRWIPAAVQWMILGLVVFMAAAILSHWSDLDTASRITFSGLCVLGLYILWRSRRAVRSASQWLDHGRSSYVGDIGFVLISLFNGFVIVAAIDPGAPGWLVAVLAIAAIIVGHTIVATAKARTIGEQPMVHDHPATLHGSADARTSRRSPTTRRPTEPDQPTHNPLHPRTGTPQ